MRPEEILNYMEFKATRLPEREDGTPLPSDASGYYAATVHSPMEWAACGKGYDSLPYRFTYPDVYVSGECFGRRESRGDSISQPDMCPRVAQLLKENTTRFVFLEDPAFLEWLPEATEEIVDDDYHFEGYLMRYPGTNKHRPLENWLKTFEAILPLFLTGDVVIPQWPETLTVAVIAGSPEGFPSEKVLAIDGSLGKHGYLLQASPHPFYPGHSSLGVSYCFTGEQPGYLKASAVQAKHHLVLSLLSACCQVACDEKAMLAFDGGTPDAVIAVTEHLLQRDLTGEERLIVHTAASDGTLRSGGSYGPSISVLDPSNIYNGLPELKDILTVSPFTRFVNDIQQASALWETAEDRGLKPEKAKGMLVGGRLVIISPERGSGGTFPISAWASGVPAEDIFPGYRDPQESEDLDTSRMMTDDGTLPIEVFSRFIPSYGFYWSLLTLTGFNTFLTLNNI